MFVMEADSLQAFVPDAGLNIGSVEYKYKNMPFFARLSIPVFYPRSLRTVSPKLHVLICNVLKIFI